MPIYEYRCPKGHQFEVFQSMSDDPVEKCETCGASGVQRVFNPVAIHFKGSGFHNTDYGKGRKKGGEDSGSSNGKESSKADKPESKSGGSESKGDSKPAPAAKAD